MDYRIKNPIGIKVCKDAVVLPWKDSEGKRICYGGVVTPEDGYMPSTGWHEGLASGYQIDTSFLEEIDETVVYIGCLYHIWGHAITDNLKKIWWVLNQIEYPKLIYITVGNQDLPEYVKEIFHLTGIDLSKAIHVKKIQKYKSIIVPDNSIVNEHEVRYYAPEFVSTINVITQNIPETSLYEKVYFTRSQLKNNRDLGEKTLEKFFRRQGFAIIAPEKLSLSQQLEILRSCNVFAATEGSVSHSSLFCKSGTSVLILKKVDFDNPYSNFINQGFRLEAKYINVGHSVLAPKEYPWRGPFYVSVTQELCRHFHQTFYLPYYLHLSWYEYRWKFMSAINKMYQIVKSKIISICFSF